MFARIDRLAEPWRTTLEIVWGPPHNIELRPPSRAIAAVVAPCADTSYALRQSGERECIRPGIDNAVEKSTSLGEIAVVVRPKKAFDFAAVQSEKHGDRIEVTVTLKHRSDVTPSPESKPLALEPGIASRPSGEALRSAALTRKRIEIDATALRHHFYVRPHHITQVHQSFEVDIRYTQHTSTITFAADIGTEY